MIIKRIVKLGGAAITKKEDFETLNSECLRGCTRQLAEVIAADLPGEKTIVVHGAGSFGHFQASASGVFRGGSDAVVTAGIAATRQAPFSYSNLHASNRRSKRPVLEVLSFQKRTHYKILTSMEDFHKSSPANLP